MKNLLALVLALFALPALAAPITLTAAPYPATAVQPDAASLVANGTTTLPCIVSSNAAGVVPVCDLSALPPGTHTLVMTVSVQAKCVNTPTGATCNDAGSVPSAPFRFELRSGTVAVPQLLVAP